ncbi:MAG: [4Fe-4S] proteins maturation [Trichoglossum hirsutum]|nr:MAG: [4Fe-4S] proteins maturation [Trichoglossum hirsutum]
MNTTASISRACPRFMSAAQRRTLTTKLTVQHHPRKSLTWTATPRPLLLDFLFPPLRSTRIEPTAAALQNEARSPSVKCKRHFSSSPPRRKATAIANPRKDENGNEMTIEITPRASSRLKEIMLTDSKPSLLRVTVESGGCHGFQYLMSLTDSSSVSSADDTIFEAPDGTGAKVVMDEPSLELLKGSKIDYTVELIGSQFKIVDNPLATSSCGCGTSFDVKF